MSALRELHAKHPGADAHDGLFHERHLCVDDAGIGFLSVRPAAVDRHRMLGMLVVLGAVVGVVYAGMARDKILSYITNTKTALGLISG